MLYIPACEMNEIHLWKIVKLTQNKISPYKIAYKFQIKQQRTCQVNEWNMGYIRLFIEITLLRVHLKWVVTFYTGDFWTIYDLSKCMQLALHFHVSQTLHKRKIISFWNNIQNSRAQKCGLHFMQIEVTWTTHFKFNTHYFDFYAIVCMCVCVYPCFFLKLLLGMIL